MSTIQEQIDKYVWYHKIKIDDQHSTPGDDRIHFNEDLFYHYNYINWEGKKVLDIGCRDGKHSLEAERRGAGEIIAEDTCVSKGSTEFLLPHLGSKINMRFGSVYDIAGKYDIIIFAGVLYHLRYPFMAMREISNALDDDGMLLLETAVWNNTDPMSLLWCPTMTESPYETSSVTFYNYKGIKDNFAMFDLWMEGKFVPDPSNDGHIGRTTARFRKKASQNPKVKGLRSYWEGNSHRFHHKTKEEQEKV